MATVTAKRAKKPRRNPPRRSAQSVANEALRKTVASQTTYASNAECGEPKLTAAQKRKGTVLRNATKNSLLKFNVLCFPNSTGLKPFGQVQLDSIAQDEHVIRHGGKVCKAEPRAYGKTSRTCNAALWGVLNAYRRMVPIFSASMDKSKNQIMARWKAELLGNQLLYWMYPYLIWPFRCLGNKTQGAASQTYRGELTHIAWNSDRIVLPTIDGQKASGNILVALPLGSARGATHSLPNGTILRPDLVIFDDVQKDEDADNQNTVKKLEDLIDHTAMMLGGHDITMSAIMNCTVRKTEDLSETYLNKPGWRHVRYKMLAERATYEKEFWLGKYADLRREYDPESPTDQRRAHKACLELYKKNFKMANEGAVVTWDWAYAWRDDDPVEISAIQHAYNILIDLGEDVFASECQNEPIRDTGGLTILKPSEMCVKQSGYQRGKVPKECKTITAFSDVHEQIHYWHVWAWEPNFTGYLIDYGTFPDQRRRYFQHDMLALRLDRLFPGRDIPATMIAGLEAMLFGYNPTNFRGLLQREYERTDGVPLRIEKMGIDANGEYSKNIKQFIRTKQVGSILYPSFGRGVRAAEPPISRWKRSNASSGREEWIDTKDTPGDPIGTTFDANFWKAQFHKKLALADGSQGSIRFFSAQRSDGKMDEQLHRLLADHCFAERPKEVICGTRVVYEFPQKFKGDNHYFDCAVGNLVAASKCGIRSVDGPAPKKSLNLAELQRKRWAREGRV